jgi:hypothetical protein
LLLLLVGLSLLLLRWLNAWPLSLQLQWLLPPLLLSLSLRVGVIHWARQGHPLGCC